MSERYKNTDTSITKDGKQFYLSNYYPSIERKDTDIYIISRRGDRWDLLSYKYYGDTRYWWVIAHANNMVNGSLMIKPLKQIRIPVDYLDTINLVNKENI